MSEEPQKQAGRMAGAGLEQVARELEQSGDPQWQARARELVKGVLELHAAGLARMLELAAAQGEQGRALVDALARDGLAGSLLALHDLNPLPLEDRVRAALDDARPALLEQGCEVELSGIAEGAVQVRLERRTYGYSATPEELRALVEEAILARAPDVEAVEVIGLISAARAEKVSLVQLRLPEERAAP